MAIILWESIKIVPTWKYTWHSAVESHELEFSRHSFLLTHCGIDPDRSQMCPGGHLHANLVCEAFLVFQIGLKLLTDDKI